METHYAIIGDIGGTNVRLQHISFTKEDKKPELLKDEHWKSADFNSFDQAFTKFLAGLDKKKMPTDACLGVAGPIQNNECTMTNAKNKDGQQWPVIKGSDLATANKLKQVTLYNDFEIASYAALQMEDDDVIPLTDTAGLPNKPKAVIGVGTGIGVSMIVPLEIDDSVIYKVWACEGGHVGTVTVTEQQQDYYNYLKGPECYNGSFGDHIGIEYAIGGPAIYFMYNYIKKSQPKLSSKIEQDIGEDKFRAKDTFPGEEVFKRAVDGSDKRCEAVVDLFLQFYAEAIGDLALRCLPYSGVYLVGSMSLALADYMKAHPEKFMTPFIEARSYLSVFQNIPIMIAKEVDIGLVGAFVVAKQIMTRRK